MINNNAMVYGVPEKKQRTWVYKLLLFISFVWISLYPTVTALSTDFFFNYGNILNTSSTNFSYALSMVLVEALLSWAFFEVVFYFYRLVLSFRVYSFVVPMDKLKTTSIGMYIHRPLKKE